MMNVDEQVDAIKNCKNDLEKVMLISTEKIKASPKSSQTGTQKLDSVIDELYNQSTLLWVASIKKAYSYNSINQVTNYDYYTLVDSLQEFLISFAYEYTYNSFGEQTLSYMKMLNSSTLQLENYSRIETSYNEQGIKTGQVYYSWNETSQQWDYSSKSEYTVDENGYYSSMAYYRWDSSQWVGLTKSVYTNDANGNATHLDLYNWDSSTNDWSAFRKADYQYDSNGNQIEMIYFYPADEEVTSWVYQIRTTYSYNEDDQMTQYAIYQWDSDSLVWMENERHDYLYNDNGKETSHVYYALNNTTNQMELVSKTKVTYDDSGKMTLYEGLSADSTGEFTVTDRTEFGYNSVNDLTSQTEYYYSSETHEIVQRFKYELEYNTDYLSSDLVIPETEEISNHDHMLTKYTSYFEWDGDTTHWDINYSTNYYYSAVNSEVNANRIDQKSFSLYPNPTKGQITLKLKDDSKATLEIYNLQGIKLMSKATEGVQSSFDLGLKSGNYLYQVIQNGESYSGRLLIQ